MAAGRICVTGGAGFIGGHLTEHLERAGHEVTVLDDLSSGRRRNLDGTAAHLVVGDLRDREALRSALAGCRAVAHLAAVPSVPASLERPVETAQIHVAGTALLIEECRRAGVERIVFASSSAVYGDAAEVPVREETAPQPRSPYGAHKLAGEHLLRIAAETGGPDALCLRYFNVYGPRQRADSDYSGVISSFFARCAAGEPPTVHGDGGQTRDFVHVDDVCAANLIALVRDEPGRGRVLQVATGTATSVLDLARRVLALHGMSEAPEFGPARAGDIRQSVGDPTALARELGFTPAITLADGLARGVGEALSTREGR